MSVEQIMQRRPKAVLLYSGGLDSTIALYALVSMGVEVIALNFDTPFCNHGLNNKTHTSILENTKKLGVKLITAGVDDEFLEILRHPRHGFGRAVNPCVDCRIFMLKYAKKVMEKEGADFIATGEVIGQRPFSQKMQRLIAIDREADVEGLVVRPLSGKLLHETIPEQKGLIKRDFLFDIIGRGRAQQIGLAKKYGIDVFPTPSGGCLLTEPAIGKRFRDLKKYNPDFSLEDVFLLGFGRHFRLGKNSKIIVCRDKNENEALPKYISKDDILFNVIDYIGPLCVYFGELREDMMAKVASYAASYSKVPKDRPSKVRLWNTRGTFDKILEVSPIPIEEIHKNLI